MNRARGPEQKTTSSTDGPSRRTLLKQAGLVALLLPVAVAGSAAGPVSSTGADNARRARTIPVPGTARVDGTRRNMNRLVHAKAAMLAGTVIQLAKRGFHHSDPNVSFHMLNGPRAGDEVSVTVKSGDGNNMSSDHTRASGFSMYAVMPKPPGSGHRPFDKDILTVDPHKAYSLILGERDRVQLEWRQDAQTGSWDFTGIYPSSKNAQPGDPRTIVDASTAPSHHQLELNMSREATVNSQALRLLGAAATHQPATINFYRPF